MDRVPLPGDQLARMIVLPLPERERGSSDPQTVAEFLAYDIGFTVEPAIGFVFPGGMGGRSE